MMEVNVSHAEALRWPVQQTDPADLDHAFDSVDVSGHIEVHFKLYYVSAARMHLQSTATTPKGVLTT